MSKLVEVYLVQPYEQIDGDFEAGVSIECSTLDAAVRCAQEICRTSGGAVVFSVNSDLATGSYGSYRVLRKFGEVPEDRSLLP